MEENKKIRPIRSYVLRQGRLTKHQAEAISLYGNDLIIPSSNDLINWDRLFSSKDKFLRLVLVWETLQLK
jgi:tRNA (guanine-N7-)-methyltransferase